MFTVFTSFLGTLVAFSYVNVFTYHLPVSLRQQVCVGLVCNLKTKQKHEELFEIIISPVQRCVRSKHNAKIHTCICVTHLLRCSNFFILLQQVTFTFVCKPFLIFYYPVGSASHKLVPCKNTSTRRKTNNCYNLTEKDYMSFILYIFFTESLLYIVP